MKVSDTLKVCVVNPNYYRSSGVTHAINRIYEGSNDLPISWTFISCEYGDESKDQNLDWIPNNMFNVYYLMTKSPYKLLQEIFKFRLFLKEKNIQLIQVHHRRLAVIISWAVKNLHIPVVYTGQLTYKKNILLNVATKLHIVAISDSVYRNLLSTTKFKNIHLIYNPAPFLEKCPKIAENSFKNVACIARLSSVKNHEALLKAWSLINASERGLNLLLVGEGVLKVHLEDLAKSLNIHDSVKFIGYTPNVSSIINKCLFLVLTSWIEGHPLSIIEAAGMGRATLVTDVDGSRDCVPKNASITNKVDPNSYEAIAQALDEWIINPHKVIPEGEKFYNFWKKKASLKNVSLHYFDLYKLILKINY